MPLFDPSPINLFVDKAGRLVLPKSVRQLLRVTPETPLELVRKGDGVLLRRVEERPAMQQLDGLWVHQGTPEPSANWADPVEQQRDERTQTAEALATATATAAAAAAAAAAMDSPGKA